VVVDVVAVQTTTKRKLPKKWLWSLVNIVGHFLLNQQHFVPTVEQEGQRNLKTRKQQKIEEISK
jgi:cytochrome oxidase assembly protein ShyY1